MAGMAVITLLHATELRAGDQPPPTGAESKPNIRAPADPDWRLSSLTRLPDTFRVPTLPAEPSPFRPRGRSMLEREDAIGVPAEAPLVHNSTVWERLAEYRAHDRVRVLTLWETGGSSVSLQADHRGDPSLQWTSRSMNRSGAAHGILDEWLSRSLGAMIGRGAHGARSTGGETLSRPEHPADAGVTPP